jgi:hypothetical protein
VTEQPVTVPGPPPLVTVAGVELMHTGTWNLASGPATFTTDDLRAAVAALDCPAVRRPVLKLGHVPDAAPGQPAIGFVANMAVSEDGRTLVGDYIGMPGWLAAADAAGVSVLSSAYPDRSIEGQYAYRCQLGHTHPFVVTAVALLGLEEPGIGTIQSLQDLADLYGVAAAGAPGSGRAVVIPVHASKGHAMPDSLRVAAQATTEDVRRAFYASPLGAGWSTWIEEMQLDPPQLIVVDDETNTRSRVPYAVSDGDGEAAVSFGDPVRIVVRYEDAAEPVAAAAGRSVRYASREQSRRSGDAAPPKTPASGQAAAAPPQKGTPMDLNKIREALGLGPDASDDDVREAIVAAGLVTAPPEPAAEPVAATRHADGTMVIDASAWDEQQKRIQRLEADAQRRRVAERDQVVAEAIADGKFPPARREHWTRLWDADPEGTRQVIASLAKNVMPVSPGGYPGSDDDLDVDAEFAHLFPPARSAKEA